MKKLLSIILSVLIVLSVVSCTAQGGISVFLDGNHIQFDVSPEISNGRTMVPLRKIFEALGAQVYWNADTNTVTANKGSTEISLTVGKSQFIKNGSVLPLDAPAYISDGRTLVPVRVISESFDLDVSWDDKTRTVYITSPVAKGNLVAHFLDIGQGDSIFIQLPNGQSMLIDAGEKGNGAKINSYIKNLGYSKIDYLVCTHPHSDHIGSMPDVINAFDIVNMYMPKKAHTSATFTNLLDTIEKNNMTIKEAKAGVSILNEKGISIEFVSPVGSYSDINNVSAVVLLKYLNSSFLFTGDIEETAHNDVTANIDVDILKLSHHGSYNGTTERFLQRTTPQYAFISCGKGNSYGHPHAQTINLLNAHSIPYYRTDISGDIIVSTDGNNYDIKTNKNTSSAADSPVYTPDKSASQDKSHSEASDNISEQVYKTKTGKKYHRSGCSSLSKSCIPITRKAAEAEGLTPCKNCKP